MHKKITNIGIHTVFLGVYGEILRELKIDRLDENINKTRTEARDIYSKMKNEVQYVMH